MKISRIKFENYYQFKNLEIDLTYPKGHEKEGQPLDKICIIGQSGTGKTTLLNLISCILNNLNSPTYQIKVPIPLPVKPNSWVRLSLDEFCPFSDFTLTSSVVETRKRPTNTPDDFSYSWRRVIHLAEDYVQGFQKAVEAEKPEEGASPIFDTFEELFLQPGEIPHGYHAYFSSDQMPEFFWNFWLKIRTLLDKENEWDTKIGRAYRSGNQELTDELRNDFEVWKKEHPNPIQVLADAINPVVEKFNIRISPKFDYRLTNNLDIIRFETLNGENVPYWGTSTGTRSIVLAAAVFHYFASDIATILFDEPEHSLYPDVQNLFIRMLLGFSPTSQYFFATHSPVVLSEFEPWEIVELKHDFENGGVYRQLYYPENKENHIDNYYFNTKALRWDTILTKVFDLNEEGGSERKKILKEITKLDIQIRQKLKEKGKPPTEEIERLNTLAEKIDLYGTITPDNQNEEDKKDKKNQP